MYGNTLWVPCAHRVKVYVKKQEILQHFCFICCVAVFFYFGGNVICQEFVFYFCQPYRTNTPRLFYNVSVRFMKRQPTAASTNEMLFLKNAVRVNISLSPVVRVLCAILNILYFKLCISLSSPRAQFDINTHFPSQFTLVFMWLLFLHFILLNLSLSLSCALTLFDFTEIRLIGSS